MVSSRMPLTNAERQRRWREKQRVKNRDVYLEKERLRKSRTRVPASKLSENELSQRRARNRVYSSRYYNAQKKSTATRDAVRDEAGPSESTRGKIPVRGSKSHTVVALPMVMKAVGLRKTYRRSLAKARRKIEQLEKENHQLKRSSWRLQKKFYRLPGSSPDERGASENEKNDGIKDECMMTPKSRTKHQMHSSGLTGRGYTKIRRQLLISNCLVADLDESLSKKKSRNEDLMKKRLAGGVLKKYRGLSYLARNVSSSRQKLYRMAKSRKLASSEIRSEVVTFLEREDNSTTCSGKQDVKMSKTGEKQKHILQDYMHNLHTKFKLEHPNLKVSRSAFYAMRPPHILLTNFSSRRTCLCQHHQNFSLLLRSVHKEGVKCSRNPDSFVKEHNEANEVNNLLQNGLPPNVKYRQWKKIPVDENKFRWKEFEATQQKDDFIKLFMKSYDNFKQHVHRVQVQYSEIRRLRETMPEDHVLIWMDFAENYNCCHLEEVQSAYWNATMVSLHTMVVYYPPGSEQTLQSYVAVSDVLSHNATSVYTILKKVIPILKEENPNLEMVHYLTDSPTSQYRNKTIFHLLCNHTETFGVAARWNYLEAGHGKGPCDGLGASVKRQADTAVKQGKACIQDAGDFFAWALSTTDTSKVRYVLYTQGDYDSAASEITVKPVVRPVPGTMAIHAVVPQDNLNVAVRSISCYCPQCMSDVSKSGCQPRWDVHNLAKSQVLIHADPTEPSTSSKEIALTADNSFDVDPAVSKEDQGTAIRDLQVSSWVAAVYDRAWFIGQVTAIDNDDSEVEIKFMTKTSGKSESFKWPRREDKLWLPVARIITIIQEPTPIGKNGRSFKIDKMSEQLIEQLFKAIV